MLAALTMALAGTVAAPPASATPLTGHRWSQVPGDGSGRLGRLAMSGGNGRLNQNAWNVFSPTVNRGTQQVANANLSGQANSQLAECKKRHRVCKISQKFRTHPR